MKRKEKTHGRKLVAGCFFFSPPRDSRALPLTPSLSPCLSLCFIHAHLLHNWRKCKTLRISCCHETPGWMKENAVGVGGAAHAWCLLVDTWHGAATRPRGCAPNRSTWAGSANCMCVCVVFMCVSDVVGRAGGSYWVQVRCESLRWWGRGYKMWMWTGKIRGFDESQGQLWLRSMRVSWQCTPDMCLSVCLSVCQTSMSITIWLPVILKTG